MDDEQPLGEYPEIPRELFAMQRILLALKWIDKKDHSDE